MKQTIAERFTAVRKAQASNDRRVVSNQINEIIKANNFFKMGATWDDEYTLRVGMQPYGLHDKGFNEKASQKAYERVAQQVQQLPNVASAKRILFHGSGMGGGMSGVEITFKQPYNKQVKPGSLADLRQQQKAQQRKEFENFMIQQFGRVLQPGDTLSVPLFWVEYAEGREYPRAKTAGKFSPIIVDEVFDRDILGKSNRDRNHPYTFGIRALRESKLL